MQPASRLALYEERLVRLWDILVTTLGIHTVRVFLDRAVWQTAQRHPDIALLQHDDSGLCFEALEQSYATQPQEEIEAAFNDLFTELLLILTRLLDRWPAPQRPNLHPCATWSSLICGLALRALPAACTIFTCQRMTWPAFASVRHCAL